MMEQFRVGKLASLILYGMLGIVSVIGGEVTRVLPISVRIGITAYLIVSFVFLLDVPKMDIKNSTYGKMQVFLYLILDIILCYEFHCSEMFLFGIYVQLVIGAMFLDYRICRFQAFYLLPFLVVVGIFHMPGIESFLSPFCYWSGVTGVWIMIWCLAALLRNVEWKFQENFEQEQSLDDLLKVLRVKCKEARIATKLKTDFLSGMSEEIQAPIETMIEICDHMLAEDREDADEIKKIQSLSKYLWNQVNDVIEYSKIETGKMSIMPEKYQFFELMDAVCTKIEVVAQEKNLTFFVDCNEEIPKVLYGDCKRVEQVLLNLLSNAVKYTDEGEISFLVDFRRKEDYYMELLFTVKDTGKGIRESDKNHLFEAFQREEYQEENGSKGLGLGLSITNYIVKEMNGTISVDSERGRGTVFAIVIPQRVIEE